MTGHEAHETDADETNAAADAAGGERTGPLSDLAETVDTDRTRGDSSAAESTRTFGESFDREDVSAVDGDRLWNRLESGDEPTAATDASGADERTIREIEKASYCHRCEHFSKPPAVECTREGTDILELVSLERFRVADCPMVAEDEALEGQY